MARIKHFIQTRIKDVLFWMLFPFAYSRSVKRQIRQKTALFIEDKCEEMPDSFILMNKALSDEYGFETEYVSLGHLRVSGLQYFKNCLNCVERAATAQFIFLNDASALISCLPLRSETKVIQLWHACGAFKKWGMSTADLTFGGTAEDLRRHPFYKNLSMVTVSSPEVAGFYREAMDLEKTPYVVQPLGVSRTDMFFDTAWIAASKAAVLEEVPCAQEKKIILYAPTFRGNAKNAYAPEMPDISMMKESLGDTHVLLIKHHPFVKERPCVPQGCGLFAFDVSDNLPIAVLLAAADICITDYSSIVFEYSLLERPMLFFAPDRTDYMSDRGFYVDYEAFVPGPICTDTNSIVSLIKQAQGAADNTAIRAFRRTYMSSCDGSATERIARAVIDLEESMGLSAQGDTSGVVDAADISIVIPAYNAEALIGTALQSVLDQTYELNRIECIVVDDGSTDSTWEVMSGFAAKAPSLFKLVRCETPSGSPSAPRNKGIEMARGNYLFFLDADDWLAPEAVERMLDRASEWGSDVLLVKLVGEGGRDVPKSMFSQNQPKVNIYSSRVMWTFAPLKLFKRSLIVSNGLRFPFHMPEDISFVLRAYCLAGTVSVAADYDYYHVTAAVDATHASITTWDDVSDNIESLKDVFGWIQMKTPLILRDRALVPRIFRRDIYRMLLAVCREDTQENRDLYRKIIEMAKPFYNYRMQLTNRGPSKETLSLAMKGDYDALFAFVQSSEEESS